MIFRRFYRDNDLNTPKFSRASFYFWKIRNQSTCRDQVFLKSKSKLGSKVLTKITPMVVYSESCEGSPPQAENFGFWVCHLRHFCFEFCYPNVHVQPQNPQISPNFGKSRYQYAATTHIQIGYQPGSFVDCTRILIAAPLPPKIRKF